MLLFAEMSAADWVMIIGAIYLGANQLANSILAYLAKKAANDAKDSATSAAIQGAENSQKIDEAAIAAKAAKDKADLAAKRSAETLATLSVGSEQKLALAKETLSVAKEVYRNTNGALCAAYGEEAKAKRTLAEATKHPEHVVAAIEAEKKHAVQVAKQAEIASASGEGTLPVVPKPTN